MKTSIFSLYLILLVSVVFSSSNVLAQNNSKYSVDNKANQIIDNAKKWVESYKSIKINFSYTVSSAGSTTQKGNGTLLLSGSLYRMDIGEQIFFCDGNTISLYQPEINELSIEEYDKDNDQLNPLSWLYNYDQKFRAKYIRMDNISGVSNHIIDLIPIKASYFRKIRMYTEQNSNKISGFDIYDSNDLLYAYRINKIEYNVNAKVSDFTFNPKLYPGVLVNDMR